MSIKNFKVEQGLDLHGLALTNGNGKLLVNGNAIATELYVANAISGVTIDPSGWASGYIDWTGAAFDVNVDAIANTFIASPYNFAQKSYVDAVAQGLDIKASVKLASTSSDASTISALTTTPGAAMPVSFGGDIIAAGDRILVKDSVPDQSLNGIYVVVESAVPGYLTIDRASDATPTTLTKGSFVFVESGAEAGHGYVVTNVDSQSGSFLTVQWTQFSEAGSYISSVGSNLSVDSGTLSLGANVVTTNGTQTLSNKTFSDSISLAGSGNFTISGSSDIVIAPDTGYSAYIGSVSALNEIVTMGNVPAGYTDANAVNAIANVLISGGGIEYVANTGFQIDTDVIASKSYVDGVASGLDVKASVKVATTSSLALNTTGPWDFSTIDGVAINNGDRVLVKNEADSRYNGIYTYNQVQNMFDRTTDASFDAINGTGTLTKGSFVFVENGTYAGKGFVVSSIDIADFYGNPFYFNTWTQFSEAGAVIAGTGIEVMGLKVSAKVGGPMDANSYYIPTAIDNDGYIAISDEAITNRIAGPGISSVKTNSLYHLHADTAYIANAIAGTGLTYSNGQLDLSNDITIGSVSLTDSVINVTAASDVFGNADTETYAMGSNQTVGTLPTGTEVADIFITLKDNLNGDTRTSKITAVFTGNDAPTWTEYGIITSGWTFGTTISFDSSKNIIVNADGTPPFAYSVKGVFTIIK